MDLYAENILDHYRNPRHKEDVANATVTHDETHVSCGDTLTIHLVIEDNVITNVGWDGTGCAISQAGMSLLAEELIGKSLEEVNDLSSKTMHDLLGVPIGPRRVKCALLALHALKNALHKAQNEQLQDWNATIGNMSY